MKNLPFLIALAFTMQSCAQSTEGKSVPEKALTAFKAKFPDVKKVEWEMENDSEWEAEFKWKGKEYSANFNNEGEWLETEYKIKESEIPSNIRATLDRNYTDYEIEEPEIAETPSGKSYEMEIERGEEEFKVTIDSKGNLIKRTESNDNDED